MFFSFLIPVFPNLFLCGESQWRLTKLHTENWNFGKDDQKVADILTVS